MVAVFTGNALGLFDTSLTQLGSGLSSDASRHRQAVNAANGNLVLQGLDELLTFRGLPVSATRTYNSLGTFGDTGADGWVTGFERRVELIGQLNEANSVVRLHTSEGDVVDFAYTGTTNKYRSTAGEGAHDTIDWAPSETGTSYWIHNEGSTRRRDYFKSLDGEPNQGRLHQIREVKSDGVTPTYFLVDYNEAGQVTAVRSADGSGDVADALLFSYADGRLASVSTRENGEVRVQVRYGYDASGRLEWVEHDLTPTDTTDNTWNSSNASANDGKLYRTTYSYVDATSLRIATVRGSDGMLTSYTYDTDGRVKTVTRGDTNTDDADGLGETLTFTYDPGNLRTHVVDSLGRMWSYVYDESGQLKEHYGPARDGLRDATYYQYDAAGNLTHTRTQRGSTVLAQKDYEYDSNGNMTWEWDALGNAIQRTYTTSNQVASQTVYSGTDPDRTGPALPTGGATTRFVYDGQYKLRFAIGASGEVSEIQYATSGNGVGQQNASRTYLGAAYSGGYTEAELSAWASGQRGNSTLTEFLYDAKGRLERRLEYGAVDPTTGAGEVDSHLAVTRFAYDAQGLLRTQWTVRAGDRLAADAGGTASDSVVDYVYDGMGRLLDIVQRGGNITFVNGVTDAGTLDDATTLVTRNSHVDSAMQLQVTHDSGATRLEVRNAAGRVLSTVDSASGQTDRTTQNFYDAAGQLRASQDANGGRSYFFYDERGNVAAEVDATGAMTEYVRDSLGRAVQTLAHADRVDTTGWIASGKVVKSIVSEVRPGWTVDFSSSTIPVLDTANLSGTYDDGFRVENGRLVVQRAEYATSVNPRVLSTDVHALSDGAFYSAEITTDASITPTYLLFSLQNNQSGGAYRRVGAFISNGNLYRNINIGGVNTNTLVGSLSASTTYVIEAHATEGGVEYRFYVKGQDRDNGFSFREDVLASEWPQVRLQINGQMGPGLTGAPIYVDNLRHSLVRRTDRDYDTAGRLVRETDGTAVTTYEYDGASRLVRTVRSSPGETDRVIRYFHDASGRSLGTLDAEGYLVENQYDLAGRLVRTVRYATATDIADRASGDLDTLRPVAHTQDQTERLFYDGRGQLVGRLDAEGYLTQSIFDEVGNDRATLSYGLHLTGLNGTESLATLVDAADGGVIRQSLRTYNALGQVISESNHEGTLTRFYYDDAGRMVRSESAALTTEVRNGTHWYDAFGQLIGELDGQGSVDGSGALRITDGMTDAQKLAVFTAHGVRHSYDVLGRRIESIDAEGNRTWYFYDARGRQTYTVRGVANGATKNALGEVTETRYNAFGQVSETLAYTGRIAIASPYSRGQVQTAITALSFVAAVDSRQQYSYDSRGLLISQISAEGHVSHLRYTGHGQLFERTDFDGTSAEVTTRYQYDLRGLLVGQTDAVGVAGVERNSLQTHDAFGRVTASTDARGNTVNMAYDRLGRLVDQRQVIQGRTSNAVTSYDAWNRVLVSTNAMGQRTTYSYDDAARSLVVTTEEGLSVSTTRNRFGDTLTVTDNAGAVTTYQYDRDGRQTQVTNPVLDVGTTEYTARGLVARTVDGTGLITAYTYDAVGRVLTRIEDPSGLALTTAYAYDGQGRAVTVTDANGKVTTTAYDREGRVLTVARDPSGLNLRTQYTWDAAGRQLSVTEGFGTFAARTVAYAYDELGRRTTETVDPGFLDLITRYTYDANGNAVARTDAEGHVTRYVYNQANRLVFTIDPAGGVTRQWYDEAGRVVAVRQYAAFISLDAADRAAIESGNGADSLTRITNKVNAIDNDAVDRIEYRVFDNDGRLRYSIDALGNTQEIRYDAAGRAAHRLAYLTPIALSAALKSSLLQTANQTESGHTGLLAEVAALLAPDEAAAQASYSIFDGAGRERFVVTRAVIGGNTVGLVTEKRYNENDQLIRVTEHLVTIAYDPARTISEITAALAAGGSANPDKVRVTDYVYDQAGRLRFSVDDLRVVNERRYDDLGRVVESRLYMAPVSAGLAMTEAALDAALPDATGFRKTSHLYDAAGRLTRTTDALGEDENFGYDTVGNRTSYTNKLNKTWTYAYDAAGRMVEERTPAVSVYRYSAANGFALAVESLPIVTRMTYDGLGNVLSRTENAEAVAANERRTTEYTYDARGYQIRTKFPDAGRIDEATGNLVASNVRPEIVVTYDALGRAVVQKDVLGNYSYKVYDQAGRLSHEVDAAGYVTAYTYNAQGQQTKLVRYATAIDTAAMTGWTAGTAISLAKIGTTGVITADATNDRSLTTYYDARGLKTEVRQSSISYWTSAGTSTSGSPRTTFTYDVLGQLVRESVLLEGSTWAHTHHYYDQAGRRYMAVDAEGYVTAMEYDAAGQETIRIEFARAVDKAALNVSTPPALPAPGDLSTGYDRAVTSEYDALGRKTGEATQRLFQNGDGSSGVREVETSFEYDAEGNQTAVVVDGVRTTKSYDALGRLWNVIDSERLVLKGNRVTNDPNHWATQLTDAGVDLDSASLYETIKPYTVMYYDAFGNAVRVIRYANGRLNDQAPVADSANDQWTYTRYDWQGRAVATRDALNNASFTEYDAADRAVHTWSDLEDGQGGTLVVHGRYTYDAVGRQITSVMSRGTGANPAIDALEAARYNAFGEIIRKGTDLASLVDGSGGYATFNYDRAGNAIFNNQQQGNRWYRYNLAGHQVREERDWFDATGTAVRVMNTNQLDQRGRVTGVVTPSHTTDAGLTSTTTRRLDRWGNVLEEVDPRGNTTNWVYNDRNQAIRQFAPRVLVVGADGSESWQRPETRWMYDAAGRLVGVRDANGHTDRNEYDDAGRLIRSIDALGNATLYGYDGLGRGVAQQDALGYITTRGYDKLDRVTEQGDYLTDASGTTRTAHARETYGLNQRGDRIQVTNALGQTQRYNYDSRGLMIRSQTAAGVVMRYAYDAWGNKSREDNGLNAYQTWTFDVLGRQASHRDLGGNVYTYGYDTNGQRKSETATVDGLALNRKITYYPNGQIRRIELSATDYTEYQYDAAGNRTYERTVNTSRGVDMVTKATYDSHNRLSRVTTDDLVPNPDKRILDLEYAYDAVGNRRRVIAYSGYGPGVDPLSTSNLAPLKQADIPNVTLKHGQADSWRWTPGDYFTDPDGQLLDYTLSLEPSGSLPVWLSYSRDAATGEWVFAYTGTGTLNQTVSLRMTASDGSASAYDVFTVKLVGNTAPVVVPPTTLEIRHKTGDALFAELQVDDLFYDSDIGDSLTLSLSGTVPAWLSVEVLGGTLRLSAAPGAVPAGNHNLTLRATDASGASATRTLTLRAAVAAGPTGSAIAEQTAVANESFLFETPISAVFIDPNGDAFSVTAALSNGNPLPSWLSYAVVTENGAQKLSFFGDVPASATDNQLYTVRLTAVDTDGMTGTRDFGIRISNPPPNVGPVYNAGTITDKTIAARSPWTYTLPSNAFTDPNGDTLTYSASARTWIDPVPSGPFDEPGFPGYWVLSPLPSWLTFNSATRTFQGTPPDGTGAQIRVTARDPSMVSASRDFTLSVSEFAPIYNNSLTDKDAKEGDAVNIPLPSNAFTDPNGDALAYSALVKVGANWVALSTLGLGINASTGTITGTINSAPQGSYLVEVKASDGGTSATGTFTLTVNRKPTAPIGSSVSVDISEAFTLPVTGFSDPEGGTLVYSATLSGGGALPQWLSVNTSNGTLSGTPPLGATGVAVLVRATDPAGLWATSLVSINVINPPPRYEPGTISAEISTMGGNPWSYQFPSGAFTNDPVGEGVTFSARLASGAALPAWLTFNAGTRTFSGTPPVNSVTVVDILATDTSGGVASARFTLTGTNEPPDYNGTLTAQYVAIDRPVSLPLPANAFTDPNHQALTYTAAVLHPKYWVLHAGDAEPTQYEATWKPLSYVSLDIDASTGLISGMGDTLTMMGMNPGERTSYSIRITASDGTSSAQGTFTVYVSNPPKPPYSTTITVDATAPISRQITFSDLDGGALTYSASGLPSGVSLSSSGLLTSDGKAAGSYTFSVTATDSTGLSTTASFTLVAQNGSPVVVTPITNKTTLRGQPWSLNVAGTFTDPNGDPLTWSASGLPAGINFNASTKVLSGTPTTAGSSTITLTANDGMGGVTNATFTLTRTEAGPVYNGNLTAKSTKEGQAVNIALPSNAFSDPNGDTLTYTGHVYIGSSWVALGTLGLGINASTGTITGTINSAPLGSYQVRITASDGGATAAGTFTLTVNRKPTAPANTSASVILGVAFSKTVPGFSDPEGGTLAFTATTSTGAALPSWLSVNASNGTLSGTPPTGFTGLAVLVRATDPAGLWASTSVTINVVNPPPQYVAGKIPGSFTLSGGNAWSYQFPLDAFSNLPTAEAVTFTARLNSGAALPAWLSFNAGTRTFSGTPPVNSSTVVVLQATDAAGGVATTTFTITGTNEPPVYNGTLTGQSIVFGRSVNLPLPANAFTDPNHQALTYTAQVWRPTYYVLEPGNAEPTEYPAAWISLSNVGLYINANTGTITGTGKSLNYGFNVTRWSYQIKITASDGSSSAEGTFSAGVHRPPVPPASTTVTVNANQAINRQITFTDPEGGALTYSASGLPSGVTMNSTGRLSSTGKPAGSYAFSVTATDPTGISTTTSFTLVVQNNAPVVAATIPNKAAVRGQAWSLNVAGTFTDPNGDTLTWSASGLPAGISFNASTKVLSGTPTGTGVSTITLTANDGKGGVTSTSFTLTVTAPAANQAPIVATPITDQYSMWNRNWSFTVPIGTFTDPNGDPLTYSASGMPSGMTFNASTRTFAFYTPKITTGAHYNLTVTASDGRGGSVSDTFSLDVEPWEGTGGGPGGPGGMMSVGGGESLFAAMSQSVAMAESTDQAMAMSAPEPEMVQIQSMTVTPGVNQQISWYTYDAENRVQIVNGALEGTQIVAAPPSIHQSSYEVQYDAVGRESAQIFHTASGLTVHRIDYTERGERRRMFSQIAGSAQGVPTAVNSYDNAGRLTRTVSLFGSGTQGHYYDGEGMRHDVPLGGVISSVVDYVYDADGRLVSQTTRGRQANPQDTAMSPSHPDYDPGRATAAAWLKALIPGGGKWLPPEERVYDPQNSSLTVLDEVKYSHASGVSAYDAAGRVTTYRYLKSGSAWRPNSGFSEQEQQTFTHTYAFTYQARDGYLEASVSGTSSNETRFKATTTTSTYDSAGRRILIEDETPIPDQDSIQSKREFAYNADGQILTRKDWYKDGSTWKQGRDEGSYPLQNIAPTVISNEAWNNDLSTSEREAWYDARDNQRLTYAAGQLVATQNEAGKLDVTGQLTGFSNTTMGRTQVQVQQGDTLRSLAQRVYGNENLWYVLADANGLDGDDALVAGSSLTAPEVKTSTNDAQTFKPYDPSEITGPTTPSLPYIPPPDQGCGVVGQIIMLVVVIAVTYFTAGALTGLAASTLGSMGSAMLVGGIAGAAGSAAGQVAGNMTGVVDGFSFKDIAMGAVTGAIGGALTQSFGAGAKAAAGSGKLVSGATKFATYTTKGGAQLTALGQTTVGLATYAGGVASNKLMGRDTDFSWKGVAASVAGSFAGSAVGSRVGGRWGVFGSSLADSATTATARRTFGMEKQDWSSIVAQAIGSTLGSMATGAGSLKEIGSSGNTKAASTPAFPPTGPFAGAGAGGSGGDGNYEVAVAPDDAATVSMSGGGGGGGGGSFSGSRPQVSPQEKAEWIRQVEAYATYNGYELPSDRSYNSMVAYFNNGYQPIRTLDTVEVFADGQGLSADTRNNLRRGIGVGIYSLETQMAHVRGGGEIGRYEAPAPTAWLGYGTRAAYHAATSRATNQDFNGVLDLALDGIQQFRASNYRMVLDANGPGEAAAASVVYAINELTTKAAEETVGLMRLAVDSEARAQMADGIERFLANPEMTMTMAAWTWWQQPTNEKLRGAGVLLAGGLAGLARAPARAGSATPLEVASWGDIGVPRSGRHLSNLRAVSADAVNAGFDNLGLKPPYLSSVRPREFSAAADLDFVRVHGPTNQEGVWMARSSEIEGMSPAQIKDHLALKYEPTHISPVTVLEGAPMRVGRVGPQPQWGSMSPPGFQYELLDISKAVFHPARPFP